MEDFFTRSPGGACGGPQADITTIRRRKMKFTTKARLLAALCAALGAGLAAAPAAFADGQPRQLTASAKLYKQYFQEASKEFDVPVELLESIAYAETRWISHVPKGQLKKN